MLAEHKVTSEKVAIKIVNTGTIGTKYFTAKRY
jgi:hypothetical protein